MAIDKQEEGKSKRVYLDNCVYNRPFDDQSQRRIFLETIAFITLLELVEKGKFETIDSDAFGVRKQDDFRSRQESKD